MGNVVVGSLVIALAEYVGVVCDGFLLLVFMLAVMMVVVLVVVVVVETPPLTGHTAVPGAPMICPGIAECVRRSGLNIVLIRCQN